MSVSMDRLLPLAGTSGSGCSCCPLATVQPPPAGTGIKYVTS